MMKYQIFHTGGVFRPMLDLDSLPGSQVAGSQVSGSQVSGSQVLPKSKRELELEERLRERDEEMVCLKFRMQYLENKKNRFKSGEGDLKEKVLALVEKVGKLEETNEGLLKVRNRLTHQEYIYLGRIKDLESELKKSVEEIELTTASLGEQVQTLMGEVDEKDKTIEDLVKAKLEGQKHDAKIIEIREDELRKMRKEICKWMGSTVRLDWIISEAAKVGAIRLPDHEWITDMAHDLEFPEGDDRSVYLYEIPRETRNQYLPNYADAHMEDIDVEDERELLEELSEEASEFSRNIPPSLENLLQSDPELAKKKIVTIQRAFRGYSQMILLRRRSDPEFLEKSAILIQKIVRGHISRKVRYYSADNIVMGERNIFEINLCIRRRMNQRKIVFFNTGTDLYRYTWCRYMNADTLSGMIGLHSQSINVHPNGRVKCSTLTSHCFVVENMTTRVSRIIRIPNAGVFMEEEKIIHFDVHTGVSLNEDDYYGGAHDTSSFNPMEFSGEGEEFNRLPQNSETQASLSDYRDLPIAGHFAEEAAPSPTSFDGLD